MPGNTWRRVRLKGFKTPQYVQGAASQRVNQGTKPLGHRYRECTPRSLPVLECIYFVFIRHTGKVHLIGFIHHTVKVRGVIVCKRNNTRMGSNNTRPDNCNSSRRGSNNKHSDYKRSRSNNAATTSTGITRGVNQMVPVYGRT